ncbi:MAG: hypothetical protein IT184_03910 [Acidobacteria bacterium]|nr:hypothetical protein [Acidobacteriota bacterium]
MKTCVLAAAAALAVAVPAHAQLPKSLPIAVVDVRGFFSGLSRDPVTADQLTPPVTTAELPNRALGGIAGVHLFVWRGRSMALGLGGEGVIARARAQQNDEETGAPLGAPITQRMRGLAGTVSLNFGHRDGWSYVSAGMGPLTLNTYDTEQAPDAPPPTRMTINMGAGARWFATRHVAFCFDLRFYQTRPETPTDAYPGRQRARVRVLSAGISIR